MILKTGCGEITYDFRQPVCFYSAEYRPEIRDLRLGVSGMYQFYTLSNGLRIGAEVMPQVKSVTAGFFIQAGGMTETAEQNGIYHFVEHMLFKGTERRNACQLVQAIDRTGGTLNAFTSDEYTCVYVKTLDRQIETAVDVLCDMLFHSRLAAEDIALEKKNPGWCENSR